MEIQLINLKLKRKMNFLLIRWLKREAVRAAAAVPAAGVPARMEINSDLKSLLFTERETKNQWSGFAILSILLP